MQCLRLAFILGVAALALADVDVTTPLSPSTPPDLPTDADLAPQYEDLSDRQQLPSTPPPEPSALSVGVTLWTCDCDFKDFLNYVRTKSSQDATEIPEIRCQGPDGVMEVWSDATALKYCPDQEYDDSSSEEYDDEYEDIAVAEETDVADHGVVPIDDLQEPDTVQRQETIAIVSGDVTDDVDETLDIDYDGDEEIDVLYGADTDVVLYGVPAFVLVLLLAAFTVIAVGVAVTVCRALARREPERRGWAPLDEEGGDGDAVYVKVPLE